MKFDLIIFDCDGVVVDSELIVNRVAAQLKTKLGYKITTQEHIEKFVGLSNKAPEYNEVYKKLPANYQELAFKKKEEAIKNELKAIDGIEKVLKNLTLPYCLASSGTMQKMKLTLGVTNLYNYFEGKIFSSQMVEKGKPAPDVFLYAAKEMGFKPRQCLVIEDSVPGIRAAKAAGMTVFGFTGGSHMSKVMINRVKAEKPDLIFTDMSQLLGLVDAKEVKV